jgi:carbon-monoxide dehydrogenase medium subunit
LIDITHAGLSYIRKAGGTLAIGATTTMTELEESRIIRGLAGGILARAAAACGSVQIRNVATLGGNLANGSPAADVAPVLLALDATLVIADAKGRRQLPMAEYRMPVRSLLIEVVIPAPVGGKRCGWSFQKLGRTELDISLVNVAAGLQVDTRRRVKWLRLALGAVAPTAIRMAAVEELMKGRVLDAATIADAAQGAMRAVSPISDIRASADYRREMSGVLVPRALEECAAQAGVAL